MISGNVLKILPVIFLCVSCEATTVVEQSQPIDHTRFQYLDRNSQSAFVVVHRGNPAYIWFEGVPKDTSPEELEGMKTKAASLSGASILSWGEFRDALSGIFGEVIRQNDYPDFNVQEGIACLVGNSPATPWAITWNSGIALTRHDYTIAEERFQTYEDAPKGYRPITDPRMDANNPGGFFPAFGCM